MKEAQFNEHGVCINAEEVYIFSRKDRHVIIKVATLNGKYAGLPNIQGRNWYCSSPIGKNDFQFATKESAIQSVLTDILQSENCKKMLARCFSEPDMIKGIKKALEDLFPEQLELAL